MALTQLLKSSRLGSRPSGLRRLPQEEQVISVTLQRRSLGVWGENIAAEYLQKKGMQIIERNFRCRLGELDIIARQGGYWVFVEVRTRSSALCGLPQESITATKIKKVRRLAQAYLAQKLLTDVDVRFDVVAVYSAGKTTINHIENAF